MLVGVCAFVWFCKRSVAYEVNQKRKNKEKKFTYFVILKDTNPHLVNRKRAIG
jgi:hypothetical protein